jgi:hypothetical protein
MRLTKNVKDTIISLVISDVPEVNYRAMITKVVQAHYKELLPNPVKALVGTKHEGHLNISYIPIFVKNPSFACGFSRRSAVAVRGAFPNDTDTVERSQPAAVWDLAKAEEDQFDARAELMMQLRQALTPINTSKQLMEHLPELVKYLPVEAKPTSQLPAVISEVVSHLKEAGWKP